METPSMYLLPNLYNWDPITIVQQLYSPTSIFHVDSLSCAKRVFIALQKVFTE